MNRSTGKKLENVWQHPDHFRNVWAIMSHFVTVIDHMSAKTVTSISMRSAHAININRAIVWIDSTRSEDATTKTILDNLVFCIVSQSRPLLDLVWGQSIIAIPELQFIRFDVRDGDKYVDRLTYGLDRDTTLQLNF
jgi:hypothetical protein